MVEETEKMAIWVDLFENVIGKILKGKDHQKFAQKVNSIREHMEALQKATGLLVVELKEAKDKMIGEGLDPFAWCSFFMAIYRFFSFSFSFYFCLFDFGCYGCERFGLSKLLSFRLIEISLFLDSFLS